MRRSTPFSAEQPAGGAGMHWETKLRTSEMGARTTHWLRAYRAEGKLLDWGLTWWQQRHTDFTPYVCSGAISWGSYKSGKVSIGRHALQIQMQRFDVPIAGGHTIHTVKYAGGGRASGPPLLLVHGYGSGIGIFYSVLPILATYWPGDVYAIDLLGCGLSSRPKWTGGIGAEADLGATELYFVDAIEGWRKSMDVAKLVLCGHSIGGYVSACYAEKHPERLSHLVLVSPAGLCAPLESGPGEASESKLLNAFSRVWNFSPFNLPFKRWFLTGYTENRFKDNSWVEKPLLHQYWYANWTAGAPSAGAYTHNTILSVGARGRQALGPRITKLSVPRVTFIYGDRDWMNPRHGENVKAMMDAQDGSGRESTTAVLQVFDGGHCMMLDNPVGFVDALLSSLWCAADAPKIAKRFGIDPILHDRRVSQLAPGAVVRVPLQIGTFFFSRCTVQTQWEVLQVLEPGMLRVRSCHSGEEKTMPAYDVWPMRPMAEPPMPDCDYTLYLQ